MNNKISRGLNIYLGTIILLGILAVIISALKHLNSITIIRLGTFEYIFQLALVLLVVIEAIRFLDIPLKLIFKKAIKETKIEAINMARLKVLSEVEKISRRDSDQNLIVDGYEFDKLKKVGICPGCLREKL